MSDFITWRKAKYVTWLVCGFVCLSVCLSVCLLLGEIFNFAKYVGWSRLSVCMSVCLYVCMSVRENLFTLYGPQFWSNRFQIFFTDWYSAYSEAIRFWWQSHDGIRSEKIPENPKNPYLSSLSKFQKFISPPKMIRIDSYSLGTFVGSISTITKNLTLKGQTSKS